MKKELHMARLKLQKVLVALLFVMAGVVAGASITTTREAHGEIRTTPTPQAFQSGGQLSVPVLKEIAATLHQIDSRLERMETLAKKMQTKSDEQIIK
jgi:hypothetical protein